MSRINEMYGSPPATTNPIASRTEALSGTEMTGVTSVNIGLGRLADKRSGPSDAPPSYEDAVMDSDTVPVAIPVNPRRSSFFAPIVSTSTKVEGTPLEIVNEVKWPTAALLSLPVAAILFFVLLFNGIFIFELVILTLFCGLVYVRILVYSNATYEYLISLGKHTTWKDVEKYITIMEDSSLRLYLDVECWHKHQRSGGKSTKKVTFRERVPFKHFTETDVTTFDASSIKALQDKLDTMTTSYLEIDSCVKVIQNDCDEVIRHALQELKDKHKMKDTNCDVKLVEEIPGIVEHMMVLAKPHKKSVFVNRTCFFLWSGLCAAYCYIVEFEKRTSTCTLEFTRSLKKLDLEEG
jgi:hypothetical protein